MIVLLIIGLLIFPIPFNFGFIYLCFKSDNKGRRTTVKDFVEYLDTIELSLCVVPPLSHVVLLACIVFIITYPLRVIIKRWYEKIKDKEI